MKVKHVSGGRSTLPLVRPCIVGKKEVAAGLSSPLHLGEPQERESSFVASPCSHTEDTPHSRDTSALTGGNALIHRTLLADVLGLPGLARGRGAQASDSQTYGAWFHEKCCVVTRACKGVSKSILRLKWIPFV